MRLKDSEECALAVEIVDEVEHVTTRSAEPVEAEHTSSSPACFSSGRLAQRTAQV
jgi:hypothetical protein